MPAASQSKPVPFRAGIKFGLWLGLGVGLLEFLGNWLVVSRLPSGGVLPHIARATQSAGDLAASCLLLAAISVLLFGVTGLLFARSRANALRCLGAVLTGAPLVVLGLNLGERVRRDAFVQLAARSASLVQAVREFEAKQGRLPAQLAELAPTFIPAVPGTGLCAYPGYAYLEGADARRFAENPWVLLVPAYRLSCFDKFLYLPRQNYPTQGFGGSLERMGDWAYVYE
jgi:hypothetical protein